jgi:hypothetical protein
VRRSRDRRRAARKAARAFVNIAILIIFNEDVVAKHPGRLDSWRELSFYVRNTFVADSLERKSTRGWILKN